MKATRSRNHFYTFTVDVRRITTDAEGKKTTHWDRTTVENVCNIFEAAGKLHRDLDDVRHVTKHITDPKKEKAMIQIEPLDPRDLENSEDFTLSQPETRDSRPKTNRDTTGLLPEIPNRTIPAAPLRAKKSQAESPLALEMPAINAKQRSLF